MMKKKGKKCKQRKNTFYISYLEIFFSLTKHNELHHEQSLIVSFHYYEENIGKMDLPPRVASFYIFKQYCMTLYIDI